MSFANRREAGQMLAQTLRPEEYEDARVLAIPRGGIIVGRPIADRLKKKLEVIAAAKIGSTESNEVAIGAVSEGDVVVWRSSTTPQEISASQLRLRFARIRVQQEVKTYRLGLPLPKFKTPQSTALIVDDGVMTGETMKAAILFSRNHGAQRIVVAAPVMNRETETELKLQGVIVYSLLHVQNSVRSGYNEFRPVSLLESVKALLLRN